MLLVSVTNSRVAIRTRGSDGVKGKYAFFEALTANAQGFLTTSFRPPPDRCWFYTAVFLLRNMEISLQMIGSGLF